MAIRKIKNQRGEPLPKFSTTLTGIFMEYRHKEFELENGYEILTHIITIKHDGGREQIIEGDLDSIGLEQINKFKNGDLINVVCDVVNRSVIIADDYKASRKWIASLKMTSVYKLQDYKDPYIEGQKRRIADIQGPSADEPLTVNDINSILSKEEMDRGDAAIKEALKRRANNP